MLTDSQPGEQQLAQALVPRERNFLATAGQCTPAGSREGAVVKFQLQLHSDSHGDTTIQSSLS